MAAKAVVVHDPSGNPLANVEATIIKPDFSVITFPLTNTSDGYALCTIDVPALNGYIKIVANRFKSYLQLVSLDGDNQEIHINAPGGPPNTIHLPSLSFNKPSRDRIIDVMANFCNLRDADDIPIFTIFIISLMAAGNMNKADDWIARLKAAGSTHLDIGLTAQYNENLGWAPIYPIPSIDLTNDLPVIIDILNHIINTYDMIPHLHLPWDDNGFQWGLDNVPSIINQLNNFTDKILWNTGWDGCFPTWNRDQFIQALNLMRSILGDTAQIATEFAGPGGPLPYIDLGKGKEDYDGPLQELDVLLLEYGTGQFDNKCGMQQQLTRLFGPKYPFPLIPGCDAHSDVYYLSEPRARGPLSINAFEWVWGGAYNQIRKLNNPQDAVQIAQLFKSYGFTNFGNGQP